MQTRALTAESLQRLLDGAYSIRELPRNIHLIFTVLIALVPTALVSWVITKKLADSVRKPNASELCMGLSKFLFGIYLVYKILLFTKGSLLMTLAFALTLFAYVLWWVKSSFPENL